MEQKYKYFINYSLIFTACCLILSCSKPKDNAWSGTITVASDESMKPMVDQICDAYTGISQDAHFKITYKPERETINLLLNDQARVVFTARELSPIEQKKLKERGVRYNPQPIATDGVALITNKQNTDSLITMSELTDIFSGKIKLWSELKGRKQTGKIVLVFDNANASNLDFMIQKFGIKDISKLNISAAGSNPKVIEYVRQNPYAIGFIGVNWISDGESPLSIQMAKGLRVMAVAEKEKPTREDYFQPSQRSLGLQDYPLRRKVYVISQEMYAGLGSGLVNYITRDSGALLVEKCGLWPTVPFNREITIKKKI